MPRRAKAARVEEGDEGVDLASPQPELGQSLRKLRTSRSFALGEVAAQTGISKSFLGLVETGRSDISIGRLLRLTEFFGVGLVDLLPPSSREGPTVVRRSQRTVVNSRAEKSKTYMLASDDAHRLSSMLAVFGADGATKDFRRHRGLEFIYVIAGKMTLEFADGRECVLDEGDSVCFDANRSHSYKNSGDEELRILSFLAADG